MLKGVVDGREDYSIAQKCHLIETPTPGFIPTMRGASSDAARASGRTSEG